jgi:uncharacterized protein
MIDARRLRRWGHMTQDSMRYDVMVETALRSVVRDALHQAATEGLPGEHHLYITFLTHDDGVDIPDHLREKYPEEMTIVVQHQFWDLETSDTEFSIKLSFNDVTEHLRVPFAAITAFADPSVNFGLQFKFQDSAAPSSTELAPRSATATALMPVDAPEDDASADPGEDVAVEGVSESEESPDAESADEDGPRDDNVVALDTFRKK